MERRDFFKLASLAGLSLAAAPAQGLSLGGRNQRPLADAYTGPFLICINAAGGWDPTHLCDPKGASSPDQVAPINTFLESDIENAGNIRYAPVGGNQAFFQKHGSRLTVINGIDMQTNGHDSGSRHMWSGRLTEGFPSLGALASGAQAPELPMSYLSFGGYDLTQGIVARTRSGSTNALGRLAYPDRIQPDQEDYERYHSAAALDLIRSARDDREKALLKKQHLPRIRHSMSTLFTARSGSNELQKLQQYLPDQLDNSNSLYQQAQVALAAYRAGISVSTSLNVGGFDTHGNHDNSHIPRLQAMLEGVDMLIDDIERNGLADKVIIVMGSDFGRTPGYNDQNGKDHWPVTSMMFWGAGIPGDRVVGKTDDGHNLVEVDPGDLNKADSGGTRIHPIHIHRALRKLMGLQDTELANQNFPLSGEDLPLFG